MVKHTQTIRRLTADELSECGHFEGLAFIGLNIYFVNPSRPDPEQREKNELKFIFSHFFVSLRLSSSNKGPIVHTGIIINPFKIDETSANGNLGQYPLAKCH